MALKVSLLVSACVFVATSAFAQSQEVRRGPVPAWAVASSLMPVPETATGSVFFRRQDAEIHLSDQGQAQYNGYRVKILQPSALQFGNISIAWDPSASAPIVHGIKVFRDEQTTDVLKNATFEILRREDQLEQAKLDGTLTAVLRVPDLRVGDELEVELTTFQHSPALGTNESGLLLLGPSPQPGRYRLGLSWDEGHKPDLKMTADMTAAMQSSERAIHFQFDNPRLQTAPNDAPIRYQWQRVVEYSDFHDWPALSRHFAPLYAKASTLAPESPLKLEAARLRSTNKSQLDRASAALKLVQQNVRYIYVGLNGGNLVPASADETWRRRYGDCKGKTVLLLALLHELGIDAEAVLVNSNGVDDGFDQRLPIPQLFDHVLVRARIDGKVYWLDGTLPPVASPSAEPIFPFRWVLPVTAQGGDLERMEWRPAAAPEEISLFEIDARAGFDKPARIVSTEIVRGVPALEQQVQFSAISEGQLLELFRQGVTGGAWQTIDDVKWRYDQKAGASILTISGTAAVDWEDDGSGKKSLALPGGGFNPPERRVRIDHKDVPFYTKPEYSCHVTTVRLPSSTKPNQWSSEKSYDTRIFGRNYHRAWELREGAIRMIRGSRIEQPEITSATALRDNDRIPAFDNSMGWIFYRPSATGKNAVGDGASVPATYDIDWTASDVPCASAPET